MPFGPLVEAGWLRERLGEPGLVVADVRWRLGDPGAGGRLYAEGHLPGAAFLDVERDLAASPGRGGRHPLPAAAGFERSARAAGIAAGSRVVAYDDGALGGAARLWWLLRHFGHERAAVLDGGLAAWLAAGGELEAGAPAARGVGPGAPGSREGETGHAPTGAGDPRDRAAPAGTGAPFVARPRKGDTVEARALLGRAGELPLLDARAPERFRGELEPVDPVAGHVPGARNVPFADLAPGGRYRSPEELRERLPAEGFTAYCGSGVSACTLLVAAAAAGIEGAKLYPGSWSEWCALGLPAERGP